MILMKNFFELSFKIFLDKLVRLALQTKLGTKKSYAQQSTSPGEYFGGKSNATKRYNSSKKMFGSENKIGKIFSLK